MELKRFDWDPKYSVGFKLIDEQHKRLFAVYNMIVDAKKSGTATAEQGQMLFEQLAEYVRKHFLTEEEVMRIYGYKGFDDHVKEHQTFAQEIEKLEAEFKAGSMILMDTVVLKIQKWLVHHVTSEDLKYVSILPKDR